jgi:hypothetical protein
MKKWFILLWAAFITGGMSRAQDRDLKPAKPRTLVFELSRSEVGPWGIGLGSSLPVGHMVANGYYRTPEDGPLPYTNLDIANYVEAQGILQQTRDYGTVYFNVKWIFPVYGRVSGSVGLGLKTKRQLKIYYIESSDYHYGILRSTQSGAGLLGLSVHIFRNFYITYEYHTRLKSLASIDFYWKLR